MKNTFNRIKVIGLSAAGVALLAGAFSMRPVADAAPQNVPLAAKAKQGSTDKVVKTDAEWKKILTSEQYNILREKGTEMPGSGALLNEHRKGTFVCAGCGKPLFSSDTKFESGTGWPSFYAPIKGSVDSHADADGSGRDEVTCERCGGHLGHVFDDGPKPTGLRYCMNSAAMKFVPKK